MNTNIPQEMYDRFRLYRRQKCVRVSDEDIVVIDQVHPLCCGGILLIQTFPLSYYFDKSQSMALGQGPPA